MAALKVIILMMFFGVICESARVQDVDYDTLMSLLDEYEDDNNKVSSSSVHDQYESEEERRVGGGGGIQFSVSKPSVGTLLSPKVEVLSLVEAFLRLKGEMASRVNALINDNFDLFQRVYNLFMNKISKVHSITLAGVRCLRKIVEFAVGVISSWEIAKPSVSFGFQNY
ncbi:PREDICTED: uncharacterized protein LOC108558555 [Nicrophorus vespilloides]|uniref:Uncharacterized protein LOC108558555 n=1 Tax=Nicrophorus vespilloides TaxID=110193 RepID=A0ABM1M8V5_NICVS|nr:PREDICTED: uncharacterized protein LOC108558555 [Nicrophorus vespilloides]